MVSKLSTHGVAGFVLANGSMSTNTGGEGEIRKKMIENDLVDCMVALPGQLFYTTPISVCIWILSKKKKRPHNTLFIDARGLGQIDEKTKSRFLSVNEIQKIAQTYHQWESSSGYSDVPGFCASASIPEIAAKDFSLTPGTYVGREELAFDDTAFEETMKSLCLELTKHLGQCKELDARVKASLNEIGFDI